jgi:hypothetical protein
VCVEVCHRRGTHRRRRGVARRQVPATLRSARRRGRCPAAASDKVAVSISFLFL